MKLKKIYNSKYIFFLLLILLTVLSIKYVLYSKYSKNAFKVDKNTSVHFTSALLLGLKQNIDKDTVAYRTLWIAPDENNKLKVIGELNYIMVPHGNTFWKIEPIRYNFTNTNDYTQYLIAHSISDGYSPETFEYNFSTYNCTLDFVDKNYVSISTYTKYHGKQGKSYTDKSSDVTELEKLTDFRHTEDKVTMKDVFKSQSIPVINKYKGSEISLGECEDPSINTTSGADWSIGRQNGKWIAQIAKTFKFSGNNKNYILYNTSLNIPQSIVSYDELSTSFDSIKDIFPNAQDAISSPSEDILGVFMSNKLILYPYKDNSIGAQALSINLKNNEHMIMDQWVDGGLIREWNKILNPYFNSNLND